MATTDPYAPAIEAVLKRVDELEHELLEVKKGANVLHRLAGRPEPFPDAGEAARGRTFVVKPDAFANESAPSTAVRRFLEMRGQAAGAARLEEVYEALKAGGFLFQGKDDRTNVNGLRIAVGKDDKIEKIRSGDSLTVGLSAWYPNRPKERKGRDRAAENQVETSDEDGHPEGEGEEKPREGEVNPLE